MVQAKSENNQIKVGVQGTPSTTNINVAATNPTNPVQAANDKTQMYEQRALTHANNAKLYADQAQESAEQAQESAETATQKFEEVKILTNNALITINKDKNEAVAIISTLTEETVNLAIEQANIATENAEITIVQAANALASEKNAKTSETNALTYSNNANASATIAKEQANISTEKAQESADYSELSKQWAISETLVDNTDYSSKYYATASKEEANKAELYKDQASQSAEETQHNANMAATSAGMASNYLEAATEQANISIVNAEISITQADNALKSAENAALSEANAKESENKAKASEQNAKSSEQRCEEIYSRLGVVIKLKGRVDTLEDLPTTNIVNGDAYLVGVEGLDSYPEYYWYEGRWEYMGSTDIKLEWGNLSGTLSNQTDLQAALDIKANDNEVLHFANPEPITQPLKIQNGAGTGSLIVGADVNAGTLTNGTRKLARIAVPTQTNKNLMAILLGFDSNGDDALHIKNKFYDAISFGGQTKITNATSPMSLGFCVTKTRNSTSASDKVYVLEMDANEARFNVQPNYNGVNLATTVDITNALSGYAKDNEIVHLSNSETITGAKTFTGAVHLIGSGDSNAVGISTNTRFNVDGTNKTVLGFGSGIFYINHGDYRLRLRGKDTRPHYNSDSNYLALLSDIPDTSKFATKDEIPTDYATKEELNDKQDTLTPGENIAIENNVISAKSGSMPIGTIISVNASSSYVPEGCLPCDGTEYSAKQFSQFYQNFLKSGRLKTCSYLDYETEIGLFGQCGKFGVNTRITNICSNDNLIVGGNYNGDTSNIFTYKRNGDDELTISEYVSIDDSCTNNNGIVSNFANGGVTINNINSNEVKFIVFETSEDVITEQHIVSFSDLYSLRISNGLLQLIQYDSSDILISSCVVEPNTKYTLQIIGQTNFVIINGVTKKTSIDEYIFDYLTPINSSLVFGYGKNQSPFLGYLFLTLSTYASRISLTEADNDYATLIENGYWSDLNNNYNGSSIGLDEYGLSVIGTPNSGDTISFETQNFFRVPLIKDGTVIQQALTSDELGKAYNAGLPNIEGSLYAKFGIRSTDKISSDGCIVTDNVSSGWIGGAQQSGYSSNNTSIDASLSSSVYGNSDTVQMNAVALRYFVVVANGTVNQSQMDWSEWSSSLQSKMNADHSNDTKPYIVEVSDKSLMPSWYRVWSDGWCEQGAYYVASGTSATVSFLVEYNSTPLVTLSEASTASGTDTGGFDMVTAATNITTASFRISIASGRSIYWEAKGYIN